MISVTMGFQSPFHRGNGCNHCRWCSLWYIERKAAFQSPFHRGNGCNLGLRDAGHRHSTTIAFSPLFIGVTVATLDSRLTPHSSFAFSPLFIGVTVVTWSPDPRNAPQMHFQSPFHRGNGCNIQQSGQAELAATFQSPFHRGNGCNNASANAMPDGIFFQSPFHRGNGCNSQQ